MNLLEAQTSHSLGSPAINAILAELVFAYSLSMGFFVGTLPGKAIGNAPELVQPGEAAQTYTSTKSVDGA